MKNFLKMSLLAATSVFTLSGCYMTTIDSGEAGVEIISGSVEKNPVLEGFHFSLNPLADLEVMNTKNKSLIMNTKTQTLPDTLDIIYDAPVKIITSKNMTIPIDMAVNYKLSRLCAPSMRINYGVDYTWDTKAVITKVRDISRGTIGSATFEELNAKRELYSIKIKQELNKAFINMFGEGCVTVTMTSIQMIHLPQQLQHSIMEKQQAEQDVAKTKLQAEKRVAKTQGEADSRRIEAQGRADARIIEADAIAEANNKISESLTKEVLAYKQLENDKAAIDRWDGVKPKVMLAEGNNALLSISSSGE